MKMKLNYSLMSRIFLCLSGALFVVALFVRLIFSSWDEASLFYFSASMLCLLVAMALDWKGFVSVFRLRFTRKSFHAGRPLLIILVLLIGLNYLAYLYPLKVDMSTEGIHSLSAFSKKVAKSFNDDVDVIYLYVPDKDSHDADFVITSAIEKYQDENTHIKLHKYNVLLRPDMAQKFNLNSQEQGIFMVYKDHRERFYKTDENSITQTLMRLSRGRKTIYFSVGHGELNLHEDKGKGLSNLKKEVERLFYDTQEINLNNEMLPESAAALVVMAPESQLSEKAQNKILAFVHKGGRVLMAFDPINPNNYNRFLLNFGVEILKGTVHMDENSLAAAGSHLVSGIVKDPENPVMQGMGTDSVVIFYVTGAIGIIPNTSEKVTPLIVSPESTVLRAGFTKSDKFISRGSYNLLVQVEDPENKGEVFIAADGDLFSNQFLYQHLNPTLMFNIFSYISKDEDVISETPPVESATKDFLVTEIQYKLYLGTFILPLPILLFALAGFAWFRRRWL
jgi:hypothetical protein